MMFSHFGIKTARTTGLMLALRVDLFGWGNHNIKKHTCKFLVIIRTTRAALTYITLLKSTGVNILTLSNKNKKR